MRRSCYVRVAVYHLASMYVRVCTCRVRICTYALARVTYELPLISVDILLGCVVRHVIQSKYCIGSVILSYLKFTSLHLRYFFFFFFCNGYSCYEGLCCEKLPRLYTCLSTSRFCHFASPWCRMVEQQVKQVSVTRATQILVEKVPVCF